MALVSGAEIDFASLIGLEFDDPRIREFVEFFGSHSIDDDPDIYLGDTYLCFPDAGVDLTFDSRMKLCAIFLYVLGYLDHQRFAGSLPFQLQFGMNPDGVRDLLGQLLRNGGNNFGMLGYAPPWLLYEIKNKVFININFPENQVGLICIYAKIDTGN